MNKKQQRQTIVNIFTTKAALVLILICALVPRLLHLDAFLTLDEYLWLDRSRNFLLALQAHDWAHTFQTGHPGVTTMWTGSLGLWLYGLQRGLIQSGDFIAFLQGLSWDHQHPEIFTYLRLPTVLLTALGIVGIAYLLTRLFNRRVGTIAGLLLALDPWYLAYSRVLHHDALMTTFMTLAALAMLLYVWRESGRWALFFSGLCAGLALLSKALSLFILPWVALMLLIALSLRRWSFLRILGAVAGWALTTWMAFFIPWPAMWLRPANTLLRMRQMLTTYAINPHAKGQFFLGQPVADPGALYYPLLTLFALTPLVMLGLSTLIVTQGKRAFTAKSKTWRTNPGWLLIIYVVAFSVFISLGEKKQQRYLLASLVMINAVAALGLAALVDPLRAALTRGLSRFPTLKRRVPDNVLFTSFSIALIVIQGATCLPHHPYYSTYYNPLLGGNQAAANMLLVGWGEGNELAADYLNGLPDAQKITVVANIVTAFAPYFEGQSWLWWPQTKVLAADYVILHRRDVQRGQPDPHIVRYIQETWPLERTITLHGTPYVWIYRAPAADWTLPVGEEDSTLGRLGLLAYRVSPKQVISGQRLTVTLYLQQVPEAAARRSVYLQSSQGEWEAQCATPCANPLTVEARSIFEEVHYVDPTSNIEPGVYQINIGFQHEPETAIRWLSLPTSPEVHVLQDENLMNTK